MCYGFGKQRREVEANSKEDSIFHRKMEIIKIDRMNHIPNIIYMMKQDKGKVYSQREHLYKLKQVAKKKMGSFSLEKFNGRTNSFHSE